MHITWKRSPPSMERRTSPRVLASLGGAGLGVDVDPKDAIKDGYKENPTVFAATRRVATAATTIPWIIHNGDPARSDPVPEDHGLHQLLHPPRSKNTWNSNIIAGISSLILTGDAYFLLNSPSILPIPGTVTPGPRPTKVTWIPTHQVKHLERGGQRLADIEVTRNGKTTTYAGQRIVHAHTWNPDAAEDGISDLQGCGRSIDTSNAARKWNGNLVSNAAKPGGFLHYPSDAPELTDIQFNRLKAEIAERYNGGTKAGRIHLLEGGLKFERGDLTPSEMDWLPGLQHLNREIASAIGIDTSLIGDPASKTYANAQEARVALYEDAVLPRLDTLREAFQSSLRQWWPQVTLSLDVDAAPAMQRARESRAKTQADLVRAGVLTPNEAREALGYAKHEATLADALLAPMNVAAME